MSLPICPKCPGRILFNQHGGMEKDADGLVSIARLVFECEHFMKSCDFWFAIEDEKVVELLPVPIKAKT